MPQETENDQVQDPVNGHGDEQPKESVDDGRATNEEIERELLGDDALSETEQLQQQLAESNDQVLIYRDVLSLQGMVDTMADESIAVVKPESVVLAR